MEKIEYILCHGSGNRFMLLDAVEQDLSQLQSEDMVQKICRESATDGLLFVTKDLSSGHYTMRMFNTDGSQAEMCGNGMRCAARYVREHYLECESFTMLSGGKSYSITHQSPIAVGVETYSVEIPIVLQSPDFLLSGERFVGKPIEALDSSSYFTYLNLGNPHIVTLCEEIDLERLSAMGERVKQLTMIFPNGVNVSQIKYLDKQQIYVATYERGVGLTPSCGTAMTASCTAATLLGVCRDEMQVEVRNRGGMVYCTTSLSEGIVTTLTGNATFDEVGHISLEGDILDSKPLDSESEAWANFVNSLS